jgi:hypothetical protein
MTNRAGIAKMVARQRTKPHGNYLRYNAGCRCLDCRHGKRDYQRALARRTDRNPIIPADRSREHLQQLHERISDSAIAIASGLSRRMIQAVRTGKQSYVRAASERAIFAVTSSAQFTNGYVDATKTKNRITQLIQAGVSQDRLAVMLGRKAATRFARYDYILQSTAREIRKVYGRVILEPARRGRGANIGQRRFNRSDELYAQQNQH